MWIWGISGYPFTHTSMEMETISYPWVGMGPDMDTDLSC
jgi:hypothetical protein